MFMFLFMVLSLSLGVTLVTTSTPIALGAWILVLSVLVSILCGSSFIRWFGFIIFLVYIGGILVIFSYFAAIQPNQQLNLGKPFFYWYLAFSNLDIRMYVFRGDLFQEAKWWLSSIFCLDNICIIIILGLVLFLALISVVKVTIINVAPLRPYINYVRS